MDACVSTPVEPDPDLSLTGIDPEVLRLVRQFAPLASASRQFNISLLRLKALAWRTLYDEAFSKLGLFRKIGTTWLVDTEALEAWRLTPGTKSSMPLWRVWAPFLWGQALLLLLVGAAALIAWSLNHLM